MLNHLNNIAKTNIFIIIVVLILAILKYYNLNTTILDLGTMTSNIFHFNAEEVYRVFLGHIHLYQPIYSYFYNFFQTQYFLIILQTISILSSIFFIYKLLNKFREIYILVFLLCYALWYNILFDFHYDHLSIPLMFAFYYLLSKEKFKSVFIISILISFIKEPFALVSSFMGIYLIIKHKKYLLGLSTFIYGFVYFYISTKYIIPFFSPDYIMVGGESSNSFGNGGSLIDIALYPFTHFKDFIIDIFSTKKIIYLIALFSAFGFIIVLFSPLELIPTIPPLAIAMLSNVETYYGYTNHYTAPLIAPFMVAFIYGLPKFMKFCKKNIEFLNSDRNILIYIFTPIILSHILFSPSPFSRYFWLNKLPQYHYSIYVPNQRNEILKKAINKYIPQSTNIAISSQNSLNYEYLSHKKYYFAYPYGANEIAKVAYIDSNNFIDVFFHLIKQDKSIVKTKEIFSDFVLLDLKRNLYLIDKIVSEDKFLKAFEKVKSRYNIIYEYDDFYILKSN